MSDSFVCYFCRRFVDSDGSAFAATLADCGLKAKAELPEVLLLETSRSWRSPRARTPHPSQPADFHGSGGAAVPLAGQARKDRGRLDEAVSPQLDLSLAYRRAWPRPCRHRRGPGRASIYTANNLVGRLNGTAVLGLGDIGRARGASR